MNTSTHRRHRNDQGMTLVEVLVSIFLLSIVGTVIAGTVIAAMKTTRSTASGIEGEAELNDAIARIARDIATADPILATSTTTGWATDSPTASDLSLQAVRDNKCVRTRYWLHTNGSNTALKSTTQTYPTSACPDPRTPDTTTASVEKTVIKDFKTTDATGTPAPLFTYYDKNNTPVTAAPAVTRVNVPKITRVKIDVGAHVRERPNGVRLATSVALRALDGTLVTGIPAPTCFTNDAYDGADMTIASDGNIVPTPVITWQDVDHADSFSLYRLTSAGTRDGAAIYYGPANPHTFTDTGRRGYHGTPINYELVLDGVGGTTSCFVSITQSGANPAAPVMTLRVTPDTSAGPPASAFQPQYAFSWPAVPQADRYMVERRPIDKNVAPFNAIGGWVLFDSGFPTTPAFTNDNPTTTRIDPSVSAAAAGCSTAGSTCAFITNVNWEDAFEYRVTSIDDDFVPATYSAESNYGKALSHNAPPTITSATPDSYGVNRIVWSAASDTSIDGYRVWWRPNGTTGAWNAASGNLSTSTTSFVHTGVPLSTRYDYVVTAYNQGPRGVGASQPHAYPGSGSGHIYYGRQSVAATVLQYPADPATYATGSEINADGTNAVNWNSVSTATSYEVWEYNSADVSGAPAATRTGLTGTSTAYTGHARGTRQYYVVGARNGTGWSENMASNNARDATAGQATSTQSATLRNNAVNGDNYVNTTRVAGADGKSDGVSYQRPTMPSINRYRTPTLDDTYSEMSFPATGDAGETADPFCGVASTGVPNTGGCQYMIHAYHNSGADGNGPDRNWILGGGYPAWSWGYWASDWGVRDYVYINACNHGGCSDWNYTNIDAYPGPFSVSWDRTNRNFDEVYWSSKTGDAGNIHDQPTAFARWSPSTNGFHYEVGVGAYAHDGWNLGEYFWRYDNGANWTTNRVWVGGASYYANVIANSPYNGLTRLVQGRITIQPSNLSRIQTIKGCHDLVTDPLGLGSRGGWKPGRRWTSGAISSPDLNGNGIRGPWRDEVTFTNIDHARITEAVGRPSGNNDDWNRGQTWYDWINFAHDYWAAGGGVWPHNGDSGSTWYDQSTWPDHYANGARHMYYNVWGDVRRDVYTMNERSAPMVAGSWSQDNRYVYDGPGWGGAVLVQTLIGAPNPAAQVARYDSDKNILIEHTDAYVNNVDCPDLPLGWKNIPGTTSQRGNYGWLQGNNPNDPDSWRNDG